jgi:hypothetical protein
MTMTDIRTDHKIHDLRLPSGFAFANRLQEDEFEASGSVHGASKVCLVRTGVGVIELGVRLRPPRKVEDIRGPLGRRAAESLGVDGYIAQYNLGWQASTRVSRTGQDSEAWGSGMTNYAWDDGYLDHAAGRAKWHLTYCADHDACGEG